MKSAVVTCLGLVAIVCLLMYAAASVVVVTGLVASQDSAECCCGNACKCVSCKGK